MPIANSYVGYDINYGMDMPSESGSNGIPFWGLYVTIGVCAVLGIVLGIVLGKRAANK